jgi:hypothetical protein
MLETDDEMVMTESTMSHVCCFNEGNMCGGGLRQAGDERARFF